MKPYELQDNFMRFLLQSSAIALNGFFCCMLAICLLHRILLVFVSVLFSVNFRSVTAFSLFMGLPTILDLKDCCIVFINSLC